MKLVIIGFLVGALTFITAKVSWENQIEIAVQATKKERDLHWESYCNSQIQAERSQCAQLRQQDKDACAVALDDAWTRAYRQGEQAGRQKARDQYHTDRVKYQTKISQLSRKNDSLHLIIRFTYQESNSFLEKRERRFSSTKATLKDESVERKSIEPPEVAIGQVSASSSRSLLLVLHIVGMFILVMLITLLLLRLRQRWKRKRHRL